MICLNITISRLLSIQKAVSYALEKKGTIEEIMEAILKAIGEELKWQGGAFWEPELRDDRLYCTGLWLHPTIDFDSATVKNDAFGSHFAKGRNLTDRVWISEKNRWIPRLKEKKHFYRKRKLLHAGLKTAITIPILSQDVFYGVIEFYSLDVQAIDDTITEVMALIAMQIGLYLKSSLALMALKETESSFRNILDFSYTAVQLKDLEGKYFLVNKEFQALCHLENAEIIGKTDFELFPEAPAALFHSHDLKVMRANAPLQFEEIILTSEKEFLFHSHRFPLYDYQGNMYAIGCILKDITLKNTRNNYVLQPKWQK